MIDESKTAPVATPVATGKAMPKKERGPWYWTFRNLGSALILLLKRYGAWWWKKPVRRSLATFGYVLGTLIALVYARPLYSHFVLEVRQYIGTIVLISLLLMAALALLRKLTQERVSGVIPKLLSMSLVFTALFWAGSIHEYLALYWRHVTLVTAELDYMPRTDHERIQPLVSIDTAARDVMSDTEAPTPADFVRDPSGQYRIVMAVEPSYFMQRAWGSVDEILSMPGTSPSVAFSAEYREKVNFDVGEKLALDHNSYNCVVRTFGPWGILNYEPTNVLYLKDDHGEWVQVVSLIRWTGILFPRPEFGGVQIIRQSKDGFLRKFQRLFLGCGEWVPPSEVGNYSYLRGQALISPVISRFMAESFRFQNGFFSPMAYYHYGDIRVPDLPEDVARQPFTAHFEFKNDAGGRLYHYFALEPFDENKRGLATSLFVPADGVGPVRVYNHAHRSESLVGVSAIGQIVKATRKEYDWEHNRPVEHRPYIKDINGVRRMFFLTAIVTIKDEEGEGSRYIAGAIPEIALTDPVHNTVTWVDPNHPETWVRELQKNSRVP